MIDSHRYDDMMLSKLCDPPVGKDLVEEVSSLLEPLRTSLHPLDARRGDSGLADDGLDSPSLPCLHSLEKTEMVALHDLLGHLSSPSLSDYMTDFLYLFDAERYV